MPFALCPGETEVWSTAMRTGMPGAGSRSHLTVTTYRVIIGYAQSGQEYDLWMPLDMVVTATYGSFRKRFSLKTFLILSLFFAVPGLIYLLVWFFGRQDMMVVDAGGEERVELGNDVLQGALPTEFLDAIACARQSLLYGAPASGPVRVTLNP